MFGKSSLGNGKMNCKQKGCNSDLSTGREIPIRTGCAAFRQGIACPACGRAHFSDGALVFNRQHHEVFLDGDDMVNRDQDGVETSRFLVGT